MGRQRGIIRENHSHSFLITVPLSTTTITTNGDGAEQELLGQTTFKLKRTTNRLLSQAEKDLRDTEKIVMGKQEEHRYLKSVVTPAHAGLLLLAETFLAGEDEQKSSATINVHEADLKDVCEQTAERLSNAYTDYLESGVHPAVGSTLSLEREVHDRQACTARRARRSISVRANLDLSILSAPPGTCRTPDWVQHVFRHAEGRRSEGERKARLLHLLLAG